MVQEDLHEGSAMEIREFGNFADDADMAEFFDGVAIFTILVTDENYSMDGKFRGMKGSESEQRVVNGAEATARGEDHGELELDHHVEHELLGVDGNEDATGAFDDEPIVHEAGGEIDAIEIDFNAGPARSKIGRNGRNKFVDFVECAVCADACEAHNGNAVGTFKGTGLYRLPVNGVEGGAKQCGKSGLADAGIGASNEEVASHACLATTVDCW